MNNQNELQPELTELCHTAKEMIRDHRYEECRHMLYRAMEEHPDSAEPHNLLGLLLEEEADHPAAMRHFRAAGALDPTYRPAQLNLDVFGSFPHRGSGVYSQEEAPQAPCPCVIVYDARCVGRCMRRSALPHA